jgi:hypothetical protein
MSYPHTQGMDWSAIATWIGATAASVSALASVATAVIAAFAIAVWRPNLRTQTAHNLAHEIVAQASLCRFLFYDVGSPLYTAGIGLSGIRRNCLRAST